MSNYNIQMHNYNGVGYDNLYPKTKSNMVLDGDTNLETKLKYYSNENLLDNWYFVGGGSQQGGEQFPINQRGQTSYVVGSGAYSIDRWNSASDWGSIPVTCTLEANYLKLDGSVTPSLPTSYGIFRQLLENLNSLVNRTVTLSVLVDSVTADSEGVYPELVTLVSGLTPTAVGVIYNAGLIKATFQMASDIVGVGILLTSGASEASSICIKAIKFELGDTQTLAHQDANGNWVLNEIPNYQEQLFRCQTNKADSSDFYANKTNIVGSYYARPNLLDNWYFVGGGSQQGGGQFPINQRNGYVIPPNSSQSACYTDVNLTNSAGPIEGYRTVTISGTNSSGVAYVGWNYGGIMYYAPATDSVLGYADAGYGIDRWINLVLTDHHPMEILSDSISVGSMFQKVENETKLESKTLTFSALLFDGTLISGTGIFNPVGNIVFYSGSEGQLFYDAYLKAFRIDFSSESAGKVIAVKLELGDTQTLAHQENGVWVLNEIPNFQQELAKCQRYQVDINPHGGYPRFRAQTVTTSGFEFMIPIPVTLSKNPSIVNADALKIYSVGMSGELTGFTISANGSTAGSVRVFAQKSGNSDTDAVLFINGGHPIFDANL